MIVFSVQNTLHFVMTVLHLMNVLYNVIPWNLFGTTT